MAHWLVILLLVIVAVFLVMVCIAVFTEMKTKRKTGTMMGGGRSSSKGRKGGRNAKGKKK